MTLQQLINGINGPDLQAERAAEAHWATLAKPLGGLGNLEKAVTKMAALTGDAELMVDDPVLMVFCADNGVVRQGVSQSGSDVTTAVAEALGKGKSTVNTMAAVCGCRVLPVNIGMAAEQTPDGVLDLCLRCGTGDISTEPAMTVAECEQAILCGAELVRQQKEAGTRLILLGEMGIGNTTTTAALSCALLKQPPEMMTGRGAGLSDTGLERKRRAVQKALELHQPEGQTVTELLAGLGGLDLVAMCGACLGGAYYRIPVLLDGVISCAAALCAVRLCPTVWHALLASHVSREPAAALLLRELELEAFITADLHLGEGTGAVLALPLLQQTMAVYHSGHTFGHLGIEAYTPQ